MSRRGGPRPSLVLRTALRDVRRHLRDPVGFLFWLGIPLVVGGLLVMVSGGREGPRPQAHLLVADRDDSFLSGLLVGALSQEAAGGVIRAERVELAEGRERLEDGEATALLLIPDGFGHAVLREEPDTLRLWVNPSQRILPGMVEESLRIVVDGVFYAHRIVGRELREMAEGPPEGLGDAAEDAWVANLSIRFRHVGDRLEDLLNPLPLRFETVTAAEWETATAAATRLAAGPGTAGGGSDSTGAGPAAAGPAAAPLAGTPLPAAVDSAAAAAEPSAESSAETPMALFFLPGILMMALLFMAQGLSDDLWRERRQRTLRRFLVTPNGAATLLVGKVLAGAAFMGVVALLALAAGFLYFRLPASLLPLAWAWTLLTGLMLMAGMFLLQMHASSQRAGGILTMLVTFPLLMLGGSFFPFSVMPPWMHAVGRWTPNGWALLRLQDLLVEGPHARLAPAAGGLLAVTVLLLAASTRRLGGGFGRRGA